MTVDRWIKENTSSLSGKTAAITGATGGIGTAVCKQLAVCGADLVLLCRSKSKYNALCSEIQALNPKVKLHFIELDLENNESVKAAAESLERQEPDILILCAGVYAIPKKQTQSGFDSVFTINFLSQYYLTKLLLKKLSEKHSKVVAVGSIAHGFSAIDKTDIDFKSRRSAVKVYGNAKKYLMFSLIKLFENEKNISFSLVHPGISFTGITSHYPPLLLKIIKWPMKLIFMNPKKAALNVTAGIFSDCKEGEWIGPSVFDIWGYPKNKELKYFSATEADFIFKVAEKSICENNNNT